MKKAREKRLAREGYKNEEKKGRKKAIKENIKDKWKKRERKG